MINTFELNDAKHFFTYALRGSSKTKSLASPVSFILIKTRVAVTLFKDERFVFILLSTKHTLSLVID